MSNKGAFGLKLSNITTINIEITIIRWVLEM